MCDCYHINTEEAFFALKEEWNTLLLQSNCNSIFLTWEWLYTWWQQFKNGKQLNIIIVRDNYQNLIGIGPFYTERNKLINLKYFSYKINYLSFLGNDDLVCSDFLDLIVSQESSEVIRKKIISFLLNRKHLWDIAILSNIVESSPTIRILQDENNYYKTIQRKEKCPYIDLPSDYDSFVSNLVARYI